MKRHTKLNPEDIPAEDGQPEIPWGHDVGSLGLGDSSDTGADLVGSYQDRYDTSDREGTGERATIGRNQPVIGADIGPDRIVGPDEAGLGGGLDQAEEAILGITDEQIRELVEEDDEDVN